MNPCCASCAGGWLTLHMPLNLASQSLLGYRAIPGSAGVGYDLEPGSFREDRTRPLILCPRSLIMSTLVS